MEESSDTTGEERGDMEPIRDDGWARLYTDYRAQLVTGLQSSYDQFDKAILQLSSGGLALSLGFIREIVPLRESTFKPVLILSWVLFGVAILSTLWSYITSHSDAPEKKLKPRSISFGSVEAWTVVTSGSRLHSSRPGRPK